MKTYPTTHRDAVRAAFTETELSLYDAFTQAASDRHDAEQKLRASERAEIEAMHAFTAAAAGKAFMQAIRQDVANGPIAVAAAA